MSRVRNVILEEVQESVFDLRLAAPARRNPLTVATLDDMGALMAEAAARDARVLLISGEGRSFCAGADLDVVHNTRLGEQNQVGLGASLTWERLEWFGAPTIAVVQGHAITGGFNLALCCDLVVAEEGAIFQDTHARWGLVPGSGEVQRMVRRLGTGVAQDLLYTSRPMGATEAFERGFVCRVAAAGELRETALDLARSIVENNARSIAFMKSMVNLGSDRTVGEARWLERLLTDRGRVNTEPDPDRDARLDAFRDGRARATDA